MNKKNFSYILQNTKRKIVIHHTYNLDILPFIKDNDLLFFDDCLYSQYVFIKTNAEYLQKHNIHCVIGFSSNILRTNIEPIYNANCAEYHDRIHQHDYTALAAYMSLDEIRQLMSFNNVYIACHGANHLDLQHMNLTKLQQMTYFINDLTLAKQQYDNFSIKTSIYVFPYAYDQFPLANKILKSNGFYFIFAGQNSKRIQIEDLIAGNECEYNGI